MTPARALFLAQCAQGAKNPAWWYDTERERCEAQVQAVLAAAPSSLAGGTRERIKTILDEETTVGGTSASRSGAVNSDELAGLILAALAPEAPAEEAGERDRIIATIRDTIEADYNAVCGGTAFKDPEKTVYAYVDIGEFDLGKLADAILARSSAPEAREGEAVGWKYEVFGPEGRSRSVHSVIGPKPNVAAPVGGYVLYDALFTHPAADKLRAAVEALRTPGDDAECAAYNSALDDLYEALK